MEGCFQECAQSHPQELQVSQCQKGSCFPVALAADKEVCIPGCPRQASTLPLQLLSHLPPPNAPLSSIAAHSLFHAHSQGSVHFQCQAAEQMTFT